MFDVKCGELARVFLSDEVAALNTPAHAAKLAQAIQNTIEAELEDMRASLRASLEPTLTLATDPRDLH